MFCLLLLYVNLFHTLLIFAKNFQANMVVEGAGLVQWMGGLPDASFGFYLREAF